MHSILQQPKRLEVSPFQVASKGNPLKMAQQRKVHCEVNVYIQAVYTANKGQKGQPQLVCIFYAMPVHRWQCADTSAGSHRHWLCGGVWMGCGAQKNSKEQPAYDYECWKNERVLRRYTYTFKRYNDTYTLEWFQTCCFFVFVKCYYLVVPGSSKKTTTHTYMVLWSCSRPPAPQLNVEHTGCTRRPSKKTTILVTRVSHYHVLQHWVGGVLQ